MMACCSKSNSDGRQTSSAPLMPSRFRMYSKVPSTVSVADVRMVVRIRSSSNSRTMAETSTGAALRKMPRPRNSTKYTKSASPARSRSLISSRSAAGVGRASRRLVPSSRSRCCQPKVAASRSRTCPAAAGPCTARPRRDRVRPSVAPLPRLLAEGTTSWRARVPRRERDPCCDVPGPDRRRTRGRHRAGWRPPRPPRVRR